MTTPAEIRRVLEATDLVGLIGEHIELRKAGAEHQALCPFHDEKTPSFTISHEKQFYHCFGCGAHGDAIDWMVEYNKLPWRQALEELAGRAGITLGTALPGEVRSRKNKKMNADLEAALHHELLVLDMAVGARVTYRAIPAEDIRRYPHIQVVPDDPLQREYEAAKRIVKGLHALYGVRA